MTLIIEKFNYTQLSRTEINGKRLYACPDGSKVASVTTILDKTKPEKKKQALENWRKSVGKEKAQQITTESANRGTRMHSYLETYVKTGTIKDSVSNPYAQQSLLMAKTVIEHGMKHVDEVWGSEVSLYYPQLYAGTTDGVGVWKGNPAIFDFKQSNKVKKEEYVDDYKLQLSAYILAHDHLYNTNITHGVILMCVKPPEITPGVWGEPQYQEFILSGEELDKYKNLWWDRVEQFYLNT